MNVVLAQHCPIKYRPNSCWEKVLDSSPPESVNKRSDTFLEPASAEALVESHVEGDLQWNLFEFQTIEFVWMAIKNKGIG
jgi:hypothetical protein